MNRKLEDAMVRLAFGDVSPEEAAALEREAMKDPDAARSLASYRRMREGLKDLHDVPQDQLSKERLRDAILNQGLKPKPVANQRSWLWMPAAAAALAFGIVFIRGASSNGPVEIVGSPGASLAVNEAPKVDFRPGGLNRGPITTPSDGKDTRVASNDVPRDSVRATENDGSRIVRSQQRRHRQRRDGLGIDLENAVAYLHNTVDDDSIDGNEVQPGVAAEGNAIASAPAPERSAPIILIDSQKDGATGAQKATELPSASNVVTSG
jgi:hypothetical protein